MHVKITYMRHSYYFNNFCQYTFMWIYRYLFIDKLPFSPTKNIPTLLSFHDQKILGELLSYFLYYVPSTQWMYKRNSDPRNNSVIKEFISSKSIFMTAFCTTARKLIYYFEGIRINIFLDSLWDAISIGTNF